MDIYNNYNALYFVSWLSSELYLCTNLSALLLSLNVFSNVVHNAPFPTLLLTCDENVFVTTREEDSFMTFICLNFCIPNAMEYVYVSPNILSQSDDKNMALFLHSLCLLQNQGEHTNFTENYKISCNILMLLKIFNWELTVSRNCYFLSSFHYYWNVLIERRLQNKDVWTKWSWHFNSSKRQTASIINLASLDIQLSSSCIYGHINYVKKVLLHRELLQHLKLHAVQTCFSCKVLL
jgi:hypothetical protein